MAAYVDQGSCVSNDAALSPQIIGETGPLTGGYPVDRSKWAQYLLVVAASSVVGALFSYGYVSYSKSTSKTTSLFHSVSAGSKPAIHVHGGAHIIARQSHNANDPRKLVVPTGNGPDQPSTTLSSHRNNGDFEASQTQRSSSIVDPSSLPIVGGVLALVAYLFGGFRRVGSSRAGEVQVMLAVAPGPVKEDDTDEEEESLEIVVEQEQKKTLQYDYTRPDVADDVSAMDVIMDEILTDSVPLKDHVALTARNLVQFAVPTTGPDNIPVVSLLDMFKYGAVDIPLERLQNTMLVDFFTGGFQDITGVPVFILLDRYLKGVSPIYKLCLGPRSIVVISDAIAAKAILKSQVGVYDKGILAYILKPIMGKGLIPADPVTWKTRRKAIKPGFHKRWLAQMMDLYSTVSRRLVADLVTKNGMVVDMQERYCSASLDIIGKAVFGYEFGSITKESPVIKAVYAVLREAERRASSIVPYWELPNGNTEFEGHMSKLDDVLNRLVQEGLQQIEDEGEMDADNNSLLRFLVEMRGQEVTTTQLRDDLMTLLIAGHETTAATLTWATYELTKPENKELLATVEKEIDDVLGDNTSPDIDDVKNMPCVRYCIAEALRLYPAPPLLIRRSLKKDRIPAAGEAFKGGIEMQPGQDIMINTWSMHRNKDVWGEDAEKYNPMRFLERATGSKEYQAAGWQGFDPSKVRGLYPDETSADFGYVPFGGGGRRCLGDEFAMLESTVMLAMILKNFKMECVKPATLGMGATIFAKEGLQMQITSKHS
jgi:cytochrome P450